MRHIALNPASDKVGREEKIYSLWKKNNASAHYHSLRRETVFRKKQFIECNF
jgi:hypothetical protein